MKRGYGPFFVACLLWVSVGCGQTASPPAETSNARKQKEVPRQLGSWTGTGSTTLGFISESGSFRITWRTTNETSEEPGSFQLTLRSGISGRPLKVIAEHRGDEGGSVEFGDDPRMYEFLVESNGVNWSVTVDETFSTRADP
jgi:hypothetical protein